MTDLASAQRQLVTKPVDASRTVALKAHRPAWAAAEADMGAKAAGEPLEFVTVMLNRPEAQEAAFTAFLESQQNPASPNYHQWITPEQMGEQYGPAQTDVDAILNWLQIQGLQVMEVAPSRMFISFSGSAGQINAAFQTELHNYKVKGETWIAPASDPMIPAALSAVINSVHGLSTLKHYPALHVSVATLPQYTSGTGAHFLSPGDFATIYDINSVYSSGYTGSNQRIAIIGQSRVYSADITNFQTNTGITFKQPTVVIPNVSGIAMGTDPGAPCSAMKGQPEPAGACQDNGDQGEQTLDVERVGSTAYGANIDLVVSGNGTLKGSSGTDGLDIALYYATNYMTGTDKVMSMSYGGCEAQGVTASVNAYYDGLYKTAAAAGVSFFVSSGDAGVNGCASVGTTPTTAQFTSINYLCASSYVTCVGGTEFADTANPAAYWSGANSTAPNGATRVSALGYIPEGAWNEPLSGSTTQYAQTGGGVSVFNTPTPNWQTGTGVPAARSGRYVPDVSFDAAGHDGYYACFAYVDGGCSGHFTEFSGTSAAAPSMAAITALLNQQTGSAQGSINPKLYSLAASAPTAFHDVTVATSGVSNCSVLVPSLCNNTTPGSTGLSGGEKGYPVTAGYDEATGLGSIDVANLFSSWSGQALIAPVATETITPNPASLNQTLTLTAAVSGSGATPTGTVTFYNGSTPITSALTLSGGSVSATYSPATIGTYNFKFIYSGDSIYTAATSGITSMMISGNMPTLTSTAISAASIAIGNSVTLSGVLTGVTGLAAPGGTFSIVANNGSVDVCASSVVVVTASTSTFSCSFTPTSVGSYTFTVNYSGDSNYSSITGAFSSSLTVTRTIVSLTLTPNFTTLASNQSGSFSLTMSGGTLTSFGGLSAAATAGADSISISGSTSPFTVLMTPPANDQQTITNAFTVSYSDAKNVGTATYTFLPTPPLGYTVVISDVTNTAGLTTPATVTLTASGGFNPTLTTFTLGSVTGLPVGASLGSLSAFTLTSPNTYTATFPLTSATAATMPQKISAGAGKPGIPAIIMILFSLLLFMGFGDKVLARRLSLLLLLLVGYTSFGACGGGHTSTPVTQTGTYSIKTTLSNSATAAAATSSAIGGYPALSASSKFTLTVQ